MTAESFAAFAMLNFLYSLAPGPNAALIVAAGARGGLRAGAAVISGIALAEILWAGFAMIAFVGALDLGGLSVEKLHLFGAGALVLLGSAMLMTRAATPCADAPRPAAAATGRDRPLDALARGAFVGLTNPIALVFFASIAPQFLPAQGISVQTALAFVLAAVLSCVAGHLPYLSAAALRHGRLGRWVERGCGLALCGLGSSALVSSLSVAP